MQTQNRVLVIDDEECGRRMLVLVLEHLGYQASCGDGGKALDHLLAEHADVAAVICDMSMPRTGENGLVIHRRLESLFHERRIVFILCHGGHDAWVHDIKCYLQAHPHVGELLKMGPAPLTRYRDMIESLRAANFPS